MLSPHLLGGVTFIISQILDCYGVTGWSRGRGLIVSMSVSNMARMSFYSRVGSSNCASFKTLPYYYYYFNHIA